MSQGTAGGAALSIPWSTAKDHWTLRPCRSKYSVFRSGREERRRVLVKKAYIANATVGKLLYIVSRFPSRLRNHRSTLLRMHIVYRRRKHMISDGLTGMIGRVSDDARHERELSICNFRI